MVDLMYEVLKLSTSEVARRDRLDYWRTHVNLNQNPLSYNFCGQRDFDGGMCVQRYGSREQNEASFFQLVEFASNRLEYRRPRNLLTEDDESQLLVIPLAGHVTLTQGRDEVRLEPGNHIGLLHMRQELIFANNDGVRALLLTIPPRRLTDNAPLALDQQRGTLPHVVALAQSLAAHPQPDTLSGRAFVETYSRLLELLALSLDERWTAEQTQVAAIVEAAKTYVAAHSADPHVTPDSIAEHLGYSRRTLENALKTTAGITPHQLLRNSRLDRAQKRLENPFDESTLDRIAADAGFLLYDTFRRAFVERHQVPPRQWRTAFRRQVGRT